MLALHKVMSESVQGVLYLIAVAAFLIAAFVAWFVVPEKMIWATLIAVGLMCFAIVLCYNAFALS